MAENQIHSSAVIGDGVKLGAGVTIGPFCVLEGDITIGNNTTIQSHIVMSGKITIGANCNFYPFISLNDTQDRKYDGEETEIIIGDNNVIREYATIQNGTAQGGGKTVIGNDCLLMVGTHIAHDCKVGNNVICANLATLAGHVVVEDNVVIGGLSAVHQWVRIGQGAMIGGMSPVARDVPPFAMVTANRAELEGVNLLGLKRRGVDRKEIMAVKKGMEMLFKDEGSMEQKANLVKEQFADSAMVAQLLEFIEAGSRRSFVQFKQK